MFSRPLLDELYTPGHGVTAHATEAVTLGQFVAVTAGTNSTNNVNVAVAEAGDRAFGLAQDNAAANTLVGVQRGNGRCFRVPTTATIAAGADVQVGAGGQPETHTTGVVVGQALYASTGKHVDLTLL